MSEGGDVTNQPRKFPQHFWYILPILLGLNLWFDLHYPGGVLHRWDHRGCSLDQVGQFGMTHRPITPQQANRVSARVLVMLSLIALLAVLSGYAQPLQPDESAAAHIFQLAIVALAPAILLFLTTADWSKPARSARPLAIPALILTLALGALYYLEHYRLEG